MCIMYSNTYTCFASNMYFVILFPFIILRSLKIQWLRYPLPAIIPFNEKWWRALSTKTDFRVKRFPAIARFHVLFCRRFSSKCVALDSTQWNDAKKNSTKSVREQGKHNGALNENVVWNSTLYFFVIEGGWKRLSERNIWKSIRSVGFVVHKSKLHVEIMFRERTSLLRS